ncbi:MAG: dihydrolipoyl dehydrogenase [Nevskia sp.]|nr:dihydrolipoyl dehydrogenase [Nevskia sp.]
MKTLVCDVAIIGAGSAGLAANSAAHAAGATVLLIDRGPGGTTCARVGCMPSKLLLAAGDAAYAAQSAHRFGVSLPAGIAVDGAAVMARVRRERDRFVGSVLDGVAHIPADRKLLGSARFYGPNSLIVDDQTRVEARSIVIATGSTSLVPQQLDAVKARVLTNETVFELATLPASLAVLGAGPLGLELAQGMARLGVKVALFDHGDKLGGLRDPSLLGVARKIFGAALDLRLRSEIQSASEAAAGVALKWRDAAGAEHVETFEYILVAAGRTPNLSELALERAGLALDPHGTPMFDRTTLQCGDSAIFIAGDADHDRPVLHEASAEGRIAGANAASYPKLDATARMTPLVIVFSDPNIAAIGVPFEQAKATAVVIGEASYEDQGRAKVFLQNAGLIRIYGDHEGRLLGAEMLGPAVEHSAHLLAWCVQQKLKAHEVLKFPFYHPTFEEGLRSALRDLCGKVGSLRKMERDSITFGPAT